MPTFLPFDQNAREATFGTSAGHSEVMKNKINSFHQAALHATNESTLWHDDQYEEYARHGLINHYIHQLTGVDCIEYNYEQFTINTQIRLSKHEVQSFKQALARFAIIAENFSASLLCRWMHVLQWFLKKIAYIPSIFAAGIAFHKAKQRCEYFSNRAETLRSQDDANKAVFEDQSAEYYHAKLWYLIQSYVDIVKTQILACGCDLAKIQKVLSKFSFDDPSPHWDVIEKQLPTVTSPVNVNGLVSTTPVKTSGLANIASQLSEAPVPTISEIKEQYRGFGGGLLATCAIFSSATETEEIFTILKTRRTKKTEGASYKTLQHYNKL